MAEDFIARIERTRAFVKDARKRTEDVEDRLQKIVLRTYPNVSGDDAKRLIAAERSLLDTCDTVYRLTVRQAYKGARSLSESAAEKELKHLATIAAKAISELSKLGAGRIEIRDLKAATRRMFAAYEKSIYFR